MQIREFCKIICRRKFTFIIFSIAIIYCTLEYINVKRKPFTFDIPILNESYNLRKASRGRPLVFIHIGKNGGTSFDSGIGSKIKQLGYEYIGHKHFDWSYFHKFRKADALVMLREPVSRSISHFWFAKTCEWTSKLPVLHQNLGQFLNDYQSMMDARQIWRDGQAAVSWLTGMHDEYWVAKDDLPVFERERFSLNATLMCILAAKRLQETLWFGFIEDLDRSLELLKWQLDSDQPIAYPYKNRNKHQNATLRERLILESLMPMDLWLYRFSKQLFEARWNLYKTGIWKPPEIPDPPIISCQSTRFILNCKQGPLSPLLYSLPNMPNNHRHYIDMFNSAGFLSS